MSRIIVGVSGGIAAYKACQVIRDLTKLGHDVTVIPTENALRFVGKATFEALSGNPVTTSVFEMVDEVRHVQLGQNADLVCVVPATADFCARLTHGRADDLLAATCLTTTAPIVLAPAMHTEMWRNLATVANVATLRERGITVLEPASGRLTGPDSGPGRLPEPSQIVDLALARLAGVEFDRTLTGVRVVITVGGTHEAIDPVRFIGNSSSGRQGFALAEVAAQMGAEVTVIAGHTHHSLTPLATTRVDISNARELHAATLAAAETADVVIMAAAVADYRPETEATTKLKKGVDDANLRALALVKNPDILADLVAARANGTIRPRVIAGFAAETGDATHTPLELGQEKIRRKGADLLMVNEVGKGKVFGEMTNSGWLIEPSGTFTPVPLASKYVVADAILQRVAGLLDNLHI